MKDFPTAFWATIFLLLAGALAIIALLVPNKDNATMQVLTLASSIASGAFGYISGRSGDTSQKPANPPPPVDPAQPK